jgi:hypothetical protein
LIVYLGVEQVISADKPEWVPVFSGLSMRQFTKRPHHARERERGYAIADEPAESLGGCCVHVGTA